MPAELPIVSACEVTFDSNQATADPGTIYNNDDIFDEAQIINVGTGTDPTISCNGDLIFQDDFD